jgi:hypothetical protein
MNRDEFIAWEKRIKDRADRLWEAAGSPDGPRDIFMDEARELLAIEEVGRRRSTLKRPQSRWSRKPQSRATLASFQPCATRGMRKPTRISITRR